ncbi:MAG: 2Fe-2S iron-sulfur cluster binding domain-containing protein [Deltaproteobacteria bacterium]|nr:2Fe-2S iron-sulfur cluster binding domain-containing protein [Deltaproteobacteria bacterium]
MVTFTINGKEVQGQKDWTILDVARWEGIPIPTLCHHPAVEPYGACRLCVVEVDEGRRTRIVISCMYPVKEGIKVRTDTPRVQNVRRWIMQLLLDESPASSYLKELAKSFDVKPSRFQKAGVSFACHLCGLCVRACQEVVGIQALTFSNRGLKKEIASPLQMGSKDCISCGNCLYVCPSLGMEQLYARMRA